MRIRGITAACVCLSFFGPGPGFAEQTPYKLDEVVVTASRTPIHIFETPANVSIITKEDIEEMGATTIIDIFKREPGVFTSNLLGNPKSAQVDIRGYGETSPQNVLFLVDGRRINGADMSGADLAQVPIEMIERVEIYRGPATALYGDNAVAGAVNIITKKGEGKPTVKAGMMAGSYATYSPTLSAFGKEGKFSYYTLSSSYGTNGYRQNNTLQMKDLFGSFTYSAFENLSFSLKAGYHKDRYGMPGALSYADLASGKYDRQNSRTPFDYAFTEDSFTDMGTDIKLPNDIILSIYGSYRSRHAGYYYNTSSYDGRSALETYGFTPKLTVATPVLGLRNTLVAGFDYYDSPTDTASFSPSYSISSTTRIRKTDGAFYVNDDFTPLKDLTLGFGYRYQKTTYDIDYFDNYGSIHPVNTKVREQKDAYRASANYLLGKKGNIFVTWAKGFRLPTTDELFSPYSSPPINQNLAAQVTKEVDTGIRYNITDRIGGSLTYFQAKTDNEIYYNPYTYTTGNYDKTRRQGVEAAVYFTLTKDLSLDLLYSYTEAKFDGGTFDGNYIPLVPKNKFSSKLTYAWKGFTTNAILTYVGPRYLISDQQNQLSMLPGVTLLDLNVKYAFKSVQAYFGIKNVTGKQYSEYGVASYSWTGAATRNFYPSAERQFVCGVSYTF
jgi:iron complex outermembrane recepter protein